MSKSKVLLIDDEPPLRESLHFAFSRDGFEVFTAATGADGLELARQCTPDAVVLDLLLPGLDGLEVCRQLRVAGMDVPIIMLTARDQTEDKLRGFEIGADDYMTKPFNTRELLARIRALLRRSVPARALRSEDRTLLTRLELLADRLQSRSLPESSDVENVRTHPSPWLNAGPLSFDPTTRVATIGDRQVPLSVPECRVLQLLMQQRGRVVTRTDLLTAVWSGRVEDGLPLLEVHIRTLREKLETDPARPVHLITVPGIGYQLMS